MRIRLFLALLLLSWPAFGQTPKSKTILNSEINSQFSDNTVGAITPSVLRTVMNDLIASWQQYASVNPQAGTSYTIQTSDYGQLVTFNNASPVAVTLPSASGSFLSFNTFLKNIGAGTATVTSGAPSTICGGATLALSTNQTVWIVSDGTNYQCAFLSAGALSVPLSVAQGGTGGSIASGTLLDNITAFASTGFLTRTGAGAYSFQSATNGITLGNLAQASANTTLCNPTGGAANWQACTGGQLSANLCAPNKQYLTTGTNATYSTPTCNSQLPLYLEFEMVGAGGGGGGSGSAAGTAATAGTATCWNTSGTACSTPLFQAGGGGLGSAAGTTTVSTGGTATGCDLGMAGAGASGSNPATAVNLKGVDGADSFFGGHGVGTYNTTSASTAAVANTGSGGGGGGGNTATPLEPGGGGAAGAYCRKTISAPASSYVYTIGTHGNGGGAGTSGGAGGNGADGLIIVTARWQ